MLAPEPFQPTPTEIVQAEESHGELLSLLKHHPESLVLMDPESQSQILIPQAVVRLLVETLKQMARGRAVTLLPIHSEVTTQQAADLLNVSRPYFIKLLDEGKLPFKLVGRHRRIRFEDLMRFKHQDDLERDEAFDEMVRMSQEMGLGYE